MQGTLRSKLDFVRQRFGQEPMTRIEAKIKATGRTKRWYGEKCGYAFCQTPSQKRRGKPGSRVSSFYEIVSGRKVPKAPARRRKLAQLLGCRPSDLWTLDDNGRLVAIRVGENE